MDRSPNDEPVSKKLALDTSSQDSSNSETKPTLTVAEVNIEILPLVYEILRSFDKEPADTVSKQRETIECSQKVVELQKRFDSAREQIKLLRGIEHNKEEQLQQLELLRNQLKAKQALIRKYRNHFI